MSSKSYSATSLKDLRTDFSGATIGQVAAPGGTLASPGSLAVGTGDYSPVNLSGKFKMGMTGIEVKGLLEQQAITTAKVLETQAGNAQALADLAITAVSASKTGSSIDWRQYIPIGIVGLIAIAIVRRGA
jgi:hypothetical protein